MGRRAYLTLFTWALVVGALLGCGGNATSNPQVTSSGGAVVGEGGNASGGASAGLGGSGSGATSCTVGADQTCNDNPIVSELWGHCETGVCQCKPGLAINPRTGKCSACYAPGQNPGSADDSSLVGCFCDAARDYDTCRTDDSTGLMLSFTCLGQHWAKVEDGACSFEAATISMTRSFCHGFCPVYRVTLTADGLVSYEGEAYVSVHGPASRRVFPSAVRELADELENAHYFALSVPQDCQDYTTDSPTVTTSFSRYGMTHEIAHYHGNGCAPPALEVLEERIDQVAHTKEWVTCPPADYCSQR